MDGQNKGQYWRRAKVGIGKRSYYVYMYINSTRQERHLVSCCTDNYMRSKDPWTCLKQSYSNQQLPTGLLHTPTPTPTPTHPHTPTHTAQLTVVTCTHSTSHTLLLSSEGLQCLYPDMRHTQGHTLGSNALT